MVVSHNLLAMNANRMFMINEKKKASNTEKLSSGYRINRAADDAAGLAISEKMRRQIRGLSQASANCSDGISLVQIADGALAEIHDMLHRGTELSVKAANGTLSQEDRAYIQKEIAQLKEEIDAISEKTTFNEIQVLKGKDVPIQETHGNVVITGGLPAWATMDAGSAASHQMSSTYTTNVNYVSDTNPTPGITIPINHAASTIDFSAFDGTDPQKVADLDGNGFYTTCCTCDNHYSIKFDASTATSSMSTSGNHYIYTIGIDGAVTPEDLIDRIIAGTNNGYPQNHYTMFAKDGNTLVTYDDRSSDPDPTDPTDTGKSYSGWRHPYYNTAPHGERGRFGPGVAMANDDAALNRPVDILIQAGSEAGQTIEIKLPSIKCSLLGIKNVDVTTVAGAKNGIDSFKNALKYVSGERSYLGAIQNRLEHAINNLDNVVENTTAAESAIRDTDMARSMVEFSLQNILAQAGQAMLAQANQSNQGVLNLLQ